MIALRKKDYYLLIILKNNQKNVLYPGTFGSMIYTISHEI